MWHFDRGCDPRRGHRPGWEGRAGAWGWAGPGGARFRKSFFRGGRFFEQGDLKYVILQLLAEKPRHGYEVIKALEEKFAGAYAPSAGAVYPTLTMLEDLGYASVSVAEGGKKVYSITPEGQKHLEDNRGTVDDLFERIGQFGAGLMSEGMRDVGRAFGRMASATFASSSVYFSNKDVSDRVRDALDRATREIEEIVKGAR